MQLKPAAFISGSSSSVGERERERGGGWGVDEAGEQKPKYLRQEIEQELRKKQCKNWRLFIQSPQVLHRRFCFRYYEIV